MLAAVSTSKNWVQVEGEGEVEEYCTRESRDSSDPRGGFEMNSRARRTSLGEGKKIGEIDCHFVEQFQCSI